MRRIPKMLARFIEKQNYVLVSTVSKQGLPHTVPKGIALVDPKGLIYVINLYNGVTWRNLKSNKNITLCCVDERYFRGYQFQGIAKVHKITETHAELLRLWQKKLTARITHRLLENLQREKKTHHHEAYFPPPKTIIEISVNKIVNLAPQRNEE